MPTCVSENQGRKAGQEPNKKGISSELILPERVGGKTSAERVNGCGILPRAAGGGEQVPISLAESPECGRAEGVSSGSDS